MQDTISFGVIRILSWLLAWLPYRLLHAIGKCFGTAAYYCLPKFRKRSLSNLTLAPTLALSQKEIIKVAKESLQNLMMTCLDYAKLAREKDISKIATCENPEQASALLAQGKGIIFFCGHQANWEILFLEGTSRMPGVAIGRPINNKRLYEWIVGIREKFGGKIIEPKNAIRESLKALKKGCFLGIVGDQGMPRGGFACDFFGRRAFTSPLPAILAHRTGVPLLVATLRRHRGHYFIRYSSPLYADPTQDMESEIGRLMHESLTLLEASIAANPSQWLWQHNRWKQQMPGGVKRPYRFDSVSVLLPKEKEKLDAILPHLPALRAIYPTEYFSIAAPFEAADTLPKLPHVHFRMYKEIKELFVRDYAPKIVFNFTDLPKLSRHYRKLSALKTLTLSDLWQIAGIPPHAISLSQLLHKVLYHHAL